MISQQRKVLDVVICTFIYAIYMAYYDTVICIPDMRLSLRCTILYIVIYIIVIYIIVIYIEMPGIYHWHGVGYLNSGIPDDFYRESLGPWLGARKLWDHVDTRFALRRVLLRRRHCVRQPPNQAQTRILQILTRSLHDYEAEDIKNRCFAIYIWFYITWKYSGNLW